MTLYLLFLLFIIDITLGSPHLCCTDNGLILNDRCQNGNRTITHYICETEMAFIVPLEEEESRTDGDNLILPYSVVSKDNFCLGKIKQDNETIDIALVCLDSEIVESSVSKMGATATSICCFISIIFLLLTMVVYLLLPELRDLQGKSLMSSVSSLILAFACLSTLQIYTEFSPSACLVTASLLYFSFLCVFFWLNIVSFNVWRSVVKPKFFENKQYLFYLYNAYGWGLPFMMLIIALICHHVPGSHIKPRFGHGVCWFGGSQEIWLYFYGPISFLLFLNILMFVSTAWNLWKENNTYKEHRIRSQKFKFLLYLKLFFIMGICWTFEPLSMIWANYRIWLVTDYMNALQGILIFLLLVVFRKRVRKGLASKGLCCGSLKHTWANIEQEDCEELAEDEESCSVNQQNNVTFNELQK